MMQWYCPGCYTTRPAHDGFVQNCSRCDYSTSTEKMIKIDSVIDCHDLCELLDGEVPAVIEEHYDVSLHGGKRGEILVLVVLSANSITQRIRLRHLYGELFRVVYTSGGSFLSAKFFDMITVDDLLDAIRRANSW